MRLCYRCRGAVMLCIIVALFAVTTVQADNYCPADNPSNQSTDARIQNIISETPDADKGDRDTYEAEVIVFVIEPVSNHWKNAYNNEYYRMAFLDYALREDISITETDTFETTVDWYAPDNGFSYIDEGNIAVVAGVYNSTGHPAYADPPNNPFTAYYSEAAAEATPGHPGSNEVEDGFTHSVIAEEGTATYCGYCPYVMDALSAIYASEDYPFHYIALVGDKSSDLDDSLAHHRLDDEFNFAGYPTTFVDGGHQVRIGGGPSSESTLRTAIQNSGGRGVTTGLVLNLDVEYIDTYEIRVHVQLYQGDASNQAPTTPPAPAGDTPCITDRTYSFSVTGTDPDEDDIFYKWDIDGYETDWDGPYASGTEATMEYSFGTAGTKNISVKIKDEDEAETDWSDPLTVEAVLCGNSDGLGEVDIDDVVYSIQYLYAGGPAPVPEEVADVTCDDIADIDDVVYTIQYLYAGGPAPCADCE